MRIALSVIAVAAIATALLLACMYRSATSDPVVRSFRYAPDKWPVAGKPVRVVLLTDLHISGPDMPPARLRDIVQKINGLHPDLVLLGGDFLSAAKVSATHYRAAEAVAPLAALNAPAGVVAVMGNHDHWADLSGVHQALAKAGVMVLDNDAVRKGDLAIGGVDDAYTGHQDVRVVDERMAALGGVPILLSHSPDVFATSPTRIGLVLAGHTHCGQVSLPLFGPILTMSRYGKRFGCGEVREAGRSMIVSAGVGTSILPLRLNAPPDIWLIEIGRKGLEK